MASANVANTLIVPSASKVSPYYDDFDESKNFHRVLFRPGYPVQARELTQLQTILQNQVERFGRHIFVNGSSVIGGKLDISDIITLNVQTQYANVDIDIASFKDKTITYSSGNNEVIARVIQTSPSLNGAPACLHVKYVTGTEFGPGATIRASESQLYANLVSTANVSSNGAIAFIYDSIYFMQGFFVKVPKQAVVISKHHRQANTKVGLELVDDILTELNDVSLLDPAQESSNYQAPGAARYQVNLDLATRTLESVDDEKFINVAEIKNGIINKQVINPTYSEIEEVLARRTYDTNGNYIVKPFRIKIEDSTLDPANNYVLAISPGKAYVYGYEAENQSISRIEIPRARDTKLRTNYNININYGNYVIVNDLRGTFNLGGQGIVDLHCVDRANVSYSNTTTYNSTKIGTARIRDIEFYGGDIDTTARKYEFYFYNNQFRTITANATNTANLTTQIVLDSANSSTANDAYVGAYVKITAGPAAGDLRLISAYDGKNKIANVAVPFTANTTTASTYELRFDITDVDGFVQSTTYTGGASSNAAATIDLLNKDDGTLTGNTFISEPTFTSSFYPYPTSYVAPGISGISYNYRRVYNTITFNNGVASLTSATNEQFNGTTSTSNTSSSVMDNFLVIVTNGTGSARAVGDQVKITTIINNTTPETATLNTGNTLESFTATVYTKMQITNPAPRVKTFITANTTILSPASANASFVNATGSSTEVYLAKGQVVIANPSRKESLFISDVQGIAAIYYSETQPLPGDNISTLKNVTSNYSVDRGHRDEYYDHATINLKPGLPNKPGYLVVCVRYYKHTNDTGFFSIDSYQDLNTVITEEGNNLATGYSLIPVVNGVRMADQIDFRPARPNAANTESWTFNSARSPLVITDFTSDFATYTERRDIVVMTVNDELRLITGNIDNRTYYPDTPSRSLLLHRLRVLPYTVTKNDIIVDTLDHKRYTMAEIGRIDRRLTHMEYTASLNTLEKNATNIVIKDVDGLDRTKYGILAEDFTSHLLGDINSPDYSCAVDTTGSYSPTGGILMPRVVTDYIKLSANTSTATSVNVFDDKVMLSFITAPAITQSAATKTIPLSEYLFGNFRGQIITSPEADQWKDITYLPDEVINLPLPTIEFDITATTTINNPAPIAPPQVERLLIAQDGGTLGLLGRLYYRGNPPAWDGILPEHPGLTDPVTGSLLTVGCSRDQLWQLVMKEFDNSGYPLSHGQIGMNPQWDVDWVYGLYQVILNRPPDFAGLVYWCAMLRICHWDFQTLREKMNIAAIDNGELLTVGQGGASAPFISAAVRDHGIILEPAYIINADMSAALPTDKEYDISKAGIFTTTTTPDGRLQTMAKDSNTWITEIYQTYLGRNPDPAGMQYWQGIFLQKTAEDPTVKGRENAIRFIEQQFQNSAEKKAITAAQGGTFTSTWFTTNS